MSTDGTGPGARRPQPHGARFAEQVLAEALRAKASGSPVSGGRVPAPARPRADGRTPPPALSLLQVILAALIAGLAVGIVLATVSLV